MNKNGVIFVGIVLIAATSSAIAWRVHTKPYLPPLDMNTAAGRAKRAASWGDMVLYGNEVNECFPAAVEKRKGKVLINSPHLIGGIPGQGALTNDELNTWLNDPKNHETLDFELPITFDKFRELIYIPEDNPLTRAKIELGRQLFFDNRLAADHRRTDCLICHVRGRFSDPTVGGSASKPDHDRAPPVILNRLFSWEQFWDGRAATLEDQVTQPIFNPNEMANDLETLVATLRRIPGYRLQFSKIFGEVSQKSIAQALASYVRTLVTYPTRYDFAVAWEELKEKDPASMSEEDRAEYQQIKEYAENHPLTEAEQRGRELFFSERIGCARCHSGPNFTDEKYHNLGFEKDGAGMDDPGRYAVTHEEKDRGAFKTPTLRHVAISMPLLHHHKVARVEDVIRILAAGGGPGKNKSTLLKPFEITEEEIHDLASFVYSLTSMVPDPCYVRLPASVPVDVP